MTWEDLRLGQEHAKIDALVSDLRHNGLPGRPGFPRRYGPARDRLMLLVHSPLVGCGTWEPVARDLAGNGYAVTVPDLAGPPYPLRLARVIADSAAGRPAVLIGHSRAGPLLAAAGTMLGEAIRGYV